MLTSSTAFMAAAVSEDWRLAAGCQGALGRGGHIMLAMFVNAAAARASGPRRSAARKRAPLLRGARAVEQPVAVKPRSSSSSSSSSSSRAGGSWVAAARARQMDGVRREKERGADCEGGRGRLIFCDAAARSLSRV
jgi:hypothetical protein